MYEIIGAAACILVLVAYCMPDCKKSTFCHQIGWSLFFLYGCMIASLSLVLLGSVFVLVDMYRMSEKSMKEG